MFALATVVMITMAFPACLSDDDDSKPIQDAVEYVDLGLPSGLKWATCNLGATKPEEYGDYYAWGETESKTTYKQNNYKWTKNKKLYTKYNKIDGLKILEPGDDAVTAKLGSQWRMPDTKEIEELMTECRWEWTQVNGIKGAKVIGSNENYIFLPAAGHYEGSEIKEKGNACSYWSSSLGNKTELANSIRFTSGAPKSSSKDRYFGFSVRPVRK